MVQVRKHLNTKPWATEYLKLEKSDLIKKTMMLNKQNTKMLIVTKLNILLLKINTYKGKPPYYERKVKKIPKYTKIYMECY